MNNEYFYMQKHLSSTQRKIETLEYKKETCTNSLKFEEILEEIRVLRKIEEFLWKALNGGENEN